MGNLGDVLKKKINRMGISRQVEAAGIVEKARKEIAKYIPEEDFEVISYNRGTLKVKAKSSVVASEIRLRLGAKLTKKISIERVRIIN